LSHNSPIHILLIEDDDGHAQLVERNLRRGGIVNSLDRVADGRAGLDYLRRTGAFAARADGNPMLVLLDIKLPKVNGVEVLRQMKADAKLRRLPVIMLTTTDDPREVATCYELGCNAYITKPVDYEKFVGVVRNLGLFLSIVAVPPAAAEE
jgi:DNA-binding response OmpR family regulator